MTLADIDGVELDSETTFADLTTLRIGGSPLVTVHCASSQAAIEALTVLDDASTFTWVLELPEEAHA